MSEAKKPSISAHVNEGRVLKTSTLLLMNPMRAKLI